MALKSYSFIKIKKGKRQRKCKSKPLKDIATAGVTALIGVGLLSETAEAVRRI